AWGRYLRGGRQTRAKLRADPDTLRVIGAQIVGGEGVKERGDFLGMAVYTGIPIPVLAGMEKVYSPAIGALNEPIALAAQNCLANPGGERGGQPGAPAQLGTASPGGGPGHA